MLFVLSNCVARRRGFLADCSPFYQSVTETIACYARPRWRRRSPRAPAIKVDRPGQQPRAEDRQVGALPMPVRSSRSWSAWTMSLTPRTVVKASQPSRRRMRTTSSLYAALRRSAAPCRSRAQGRGEPTARRRPARLSHGSSAGKSAARLYALVRQPPQASCFNGAPSSTVLDQSGSPVRQRLDIASWSKVRARCVALRSGIRPSASRSSRRWVDAPMLFSSTRIRRSGWSGRGHKQRRHGSAGQACSANSRRRRMLPSPSAAAARSKVASSSSVVVVAGQVAHLLVEHLGRRADQPRVQGRASGSSTRW